MLPLLPEVPVGAANAGTPGATGVASIRRQVEDAIVFALQGLKLEERGGDVDGYVWRIEPYQGPLEPDSDDREVNRLTDGGIPAILVTTGGADYETPTLSRDVVELTLEVIVLLVADNARSPEARHRGGVDSDPGIYRMIADVHDKLWGAELGVQCAGFLVPSSERAIARAEQKAIWSLEYALRIDLESTQPEDVTSYDDILHKTNNADDSTADPIAVGLLTLG
jgi:hypothetical protein